MNRCKECGKKTVGVLIQSPEDNSPEYVPNLCGACVNAISDEVNGGNKKTPSFTCRKCSARVWSLRNGECWDCYEEACEAVAQLPDYVDPLQPPLGYFLIGATDIMAEMEVAAAYACTPEMDELEN